MISGTRIEYIPSSVQRPGSETIRDLANLDLLRAVAVGLVFQERFGV